MGSVLSALKPVVGVEDGVLMLNGLPLTSGQKIGVALAAAGLASFVWAYAANKKPAPPMAFSPVMRVLNFVANTYYNVTGRHLVGPTWKELKPLAEKGNFPFFGQDETMKGLKMICDEFEKSPGNGNSSKTFRGGVVPCGRLLINELLKNNLTHRADVGQWIQDHPDILQIGVKKPIIITGMYRSGTTLLMRLMSQDPKCRKIKLWELLCGAPPPVKEQHDTDPRIAAKDKEFGTYDMIKPGWLKKFYTSHPMDIREQDEELLIMQDTMKGVLWAGQCMKENAPYNEWVHAEDNNEECYNYVHRYLQYLSSSYPPSEDGGFFILKTPMHIYWQEAMMKQFPDARVVYCCRDPAKVVPSTLRLFTTMSELYFNHNDPSYDDKARSKQWFNYFCQLLGRVVEGRKNGVVPEKQRFDVRYPEMMEDPVAMVKKIYAHFGEEVTAEHEKNMRDFLASNPQGKHGRAKYSLEDFHETEESLYADSHVKAFREMFNV